MPIRMPPDTRRALGEFAGNCQNRSLLQQRFVFVDDTLDAARRLGLDLWVDDGWLDVANLLKDAKEDGARIQRRIETKPDRAEKHRQDLAANISFQSLCDRLLKAFPKFQIRPDKRSWCSEFGRNRDQFTLQLRQRLAIGLANGIPENAGLTLHRRFGFPLIPGSALKGLARRGAIDLGADQQLRCLILGSELNEEPPQGRDESKTAGAVSFLDAVAESSRIELDIVTPHYSRYYSDSQDRPNPQALDDEAPIPNVFPVVAAGAVFRFDLLFSERRGTPPLSAAVALATARQWLTHALVTFGVGAKSRSGYGRFGEAPGTTSAGDDLFPELAQVAPPPPPPPPAKSAVELCLDRWKDKVNTYTVARIIPDLQALSDPDLHFVAHKLIAAANWDSSGRPANPASNPLWKAFSQTPDGAAVLARLATKPS